MKPVLAFALMLGSVLTATSPAHAQRIEAHRADACKLSYHVLHPHKDAWLVANVVMEKGRVAKLDIIGAHPAGAYDDIAARIVGTRCPFKGESLMISNTMGSRIRAELRPTFEAIFAALRANDTTTAAAHLDGVRKLFNAQRLTGMEAAVYHVYMAPLLRSQAKFAEAQRYADAGARLSIYVSEHAANVMHYESILDMIGQGAYEAAIKRFDIVKKSKVSSPPALLNTLIDQLRSGRPDQVYTFDETNFGGTMLAGLSPPADAAADAANTGR